jgi:hypothetical protein
MDQLKKKCKVLMLKSDKQSNLCFRNYLFINKDNITEYSNVEFKNLYIVSDDKIEEDDWFIRDIEIYQCFKSHKDEIEFKTDEKSVYCGTNTFWNRKFCKKIIATTDSTINTGYSTSGTTFVPQPSTAFIEKYIKTYNAGTHIVDVMVEFERCDGIWNYKLKVNSQNQITITKVKDSWSREEVIELLRKLTNDHPLHRGVQMTDSIVDDWVEQNL